MELLVVIFVMAAVIFSVIRSRAKAKKRREEEARQHWQHIADTYGKALGLKFRQLVVRDEYGHENNDRWEKELTYFMRNALGLRTATKSEIGRHGIKYDETRVLIDSMSSDTWEYGRKYIATRVLIDSIAREAAQTLPVMGDISEVRNGFDYEYFVGKQFNEAGWTSEVTKASGDQGADVKVWKDGVDAVVQCKWYQNAVGNKAVQEIVAARTHYGVRNAIVVSKSGYTNAARELANTNGVCLIHHDEIPDVYERLSALLSGSN